MVLLLLLLAALAAAYIPASPTNSTQDAIAGGLNITDISKLRLQWYSNGNYVENISYQLAGNGTSGISKGILIHFSEESVNETIPPTSAPWIAMVSCDANATDASMDVDIFTLARDKGAVAALLYSLRSLACVINPEYANPATFDQVFDIFSTQSKTSARLIDYQFGQLAPANSSITKYDSQRLNNTAEAVRDSIQAGHATRPGFLYAELRAYNATGDTNDPVVTGSNSGDSTGSGTDSKNTALAMIVLYAITGCVSALFCIVIISGAVRALRHPERYGPRARIGLDGPPQGRARGLTRAILDTFPIVKFGGSRDRPVDSAMDTANSIKDMEAQDISQWELLDITDAKRESTFKLDEVNATAGCAASQAIEMDDEKTRLSRSSTPGPCSPQILPSREEDRGEGSSTPKPISSKPQLSDKPGMMPVRHDLSPEAMGRETCPICIVDFEEGDDIRVLPCEGKHRFHPECVDQWLLQLSSSCPICRQDFMALADMMSYEDDRESQGLGIDGFEPDSPDEDRRLYHQSLSPQRSASSPGSSRFSRYLHFASGRRNRRQQREQGAPVQEELVQEQSR
ncbi:hypothetical protein AGABI1DRAFT_119517 [Agaricus bisporus var. burnettii JB137-S8]|uniref:RING-type domain-containing protein n=1 Tax=Agaricus bisporus var. burnettii (strain JB137-S8 / ATCC MYA-4627 / FGSC 10392) TaxID=597362 RepID=K5XZT1_AGABU|nr:uncharacterized protein AGABI1DRAFT_119517 [Agaricus bisporus var. burnettii JB137-S8]EKM80980.1 hypothetical protein AGABI1DRAFT_119517 [Agaricus bisporus var. burnettii JB137-S8]